MVAQGVPGRLRELRGVVQLVDCVEQCRMAGQPSGVRGTVGSGGRPMLLWAESDLLGKGRGVHSLFVGAAGARGHPGDDDLAVDGGQESVAQQPGAQGERP